MTFKLALFCGGPSLERGISLNSARSVLDHLSRPGLEIIPVYVDLPGQYHKISPSQLYSNTPGDFDFKLQQTAEILSESELIAILKNCDLVFPAIHGTFGEDGTLQTLLEQNNIPFVGSASDVCRKMFFKDRASNFVASQGMHTLPFALLDKDNYAEEIRQFMGNEITRAIVKPVAGGSSIGVSSVTNIDEAVIASKKLFEQAHDNILLLEPFCDGKEFTIVVLQNPDGQPVALLPSEIDVSYNDNQIFSFRRKYLPTNQVAYHCPPNFPEDITTKVRAQAEELFKLFGMRDFARLDGWLMADGKIRFSDFNPISGMEQNSFLFQQGARVGLTHAEIMDYVVSNACRRYDLKLPPHTESNQCKQNVHVLFGGETAERQVSLMSGTNIWLKLRQSDRFAPSPYLLENENTVWSLPYSFTLNHTVEEIVNNCHDAAAKSAETQKLIDDVRQKLKLPAMLMPQPQRMSFDEFTAKAKKENAFVFLGLHGGAGEDGKIQSRLDQNELYYNGSGTQGSALCMDKYDTGNAITAVAHNNQSLITAPKRSVTIETFKNFSEDDYTKYWQTLIAEFKTSTVIIKPQSDGCSAGVIRLQDASHLRSYVDLATVKAEFIPADTFPNQPNIIDMGDAANPHFLLEAFIQTDKIMIAGSDLSYKKQDGWIELTVGVLEQNGEYYALSPSITVAEGDVLSLEEKFQGGTGVNITPPPASICSQAQIDIIRNAIEKAAAALNIQNYARLDIFFNVLTNTTLLIEANTLPGLTPSTVIYHQALAEQPPLPPTRFLERIIDLKTGKTNLVSNRQNAA